MSERNATKALLPVSGRKGPSPGDSLLLEPPVAGFALAIRLYHLLRSVVNINRPS